MTTLTAHEAGNKWHDLINGCFLDEVYDATSECLACGYSYSSHCDGNEYVCWNFEAETGDYFDFDRFDNGLDAQIIDLYEATKHIPFLDLPGQQMDWLEVAQFGLYMPRRFELQIVWKWLWGWRDTHAQLEIQYLQDLLKNYELDAQAS